MMILAEEDGAGSGDSTHEGRSQPRTASIRARPTSSRITAAELESLFQRQTPYMMTTSNFQVTLLYIFMATVKSSFYPTFHAV